MESIPCASVILVLADSNFVNLCTNPEEYIRTLKQKLSEARQTPISIYTVSGKYGISQIDRSVPVLEVEDRNKTLFSQTLENNAMVFDELMVISINQNDPFLVAAKEVVTNANKTSTVYGYARK